MNSKLRLARASMATTAASLSALSPLNVLSRGYSVTLDAQGNAINSANDVNKGDVIRTKLNDGEIESVVRDKT